MMSVPATLVRVSFVLTAVVVVSRAQKASAQVIDQLFPAGVTSIGGVESESVLSRPRTDYTARGVRVGSFQINPTLTESLGYNSNVDGLKGGHGSPVVETQAAVGAASNWSRDSLGGLLSVDDTRNLTRSQQDQTNWTASVFGSYDVGVDKLSAAYTHLNLNQNAGDIEAALSASPVPFRIDDGRLSYDSAEHGRFDIVPSLDITTYRFSSGPSFAGNALNAVFGQSFRNRNVFDGSVTTRYELAPLRNLVLVVRGTHISYVGSIAGIPSRDSNGAAVLVGIDYSAAGVFRYRALAGYQVREYVSGTYSNLSEPIVEAAVTWTPTRLTTVTAGALRDIEDSADDSIAGFTYTTGRVSVDHEYRRDILLNAHGQVQRAELASGAGQLPQLLQTAGSQTIYNAGVGATWFLNRTMRVSGTYDYNDRHAGAGTGTYTQNIALLSITFQL